MAKKTTNWEKTPVKELRVLAPDFGVSPRDKRGKLKIKKDLIHEMRVAYHRQKDRDGR